MVNHNPDTVYTVALSRAEIFELLLACSHVSWENEDFTSARRKLRRLMKDSKAPKTAPKMGVA
jgi:hypothetical protein